MSWLDSAPPPDSSTCTASGDDQLDRAEHGLGLDVDLRPGQNGLAQVELDAAEHGRVAALAGDPPAALAGEAGEQRAVLDGRFQGRRRGGGEARGGGGDVVARAGGVDQLGALGQILQREPPVDRRLAQQGERDLAVAVAGQHEPQGNPESADPAASTGHRRIRGTSAPPATVTRDA
jgi:hypothetical protein